MAVRKIKEAKKALVWMYKGKELEHEDIPKWAVGIIYLITRNSDGKFYIGKKLFNSSRRKKIGLKEKAETKTRKTYKIEVKDSGWRTYNGSCKPLLEDIRRNPDDFTKQIIDFGFSKKNLTLLELEYQIKYRCLENYNSYVENYLGKFFKNDKINPYI